MIVSLAHRAAARARVVRFVKSIVQRVAAVDHAPARFTMIEGGRSSVNKAPRPCRGPQLRRGRPWRPWELRETLGNELIVKLLVLHLDNVHRGVAYINCWGIHGIHLCKECTVASKARPRGTGSVHNSRQFRESGVIRVLRS